MPPPVLIVLKERKLVELIAPPKGSGVLEASGVYAKGDDFYVIFDNVRRVARIHRSIAPGRGLHGWFGSRREGEGYEDIAYSPHRKRFYLLIEAEKHHDGTFKPLIDECDEHGKMRRRRVVNVSFKKRNTGLEGLAALRWKGKEYLLGLCEGNRCRAGKQGRKGGGGRIHVLVCKAGLWESIARIKLPRSVDFEDYSAVAVRGDRIAVVSQMTARLWIGRLRRDTWTIAGKGRIYDFPRTKKGKSCYCTVEGVCWLTASTFVAVSDLVKRYHSNRCHDKDQSIHVFALPGRGRHARRRPKQ
jgi:hypothetical protein